MTNEQLRQSLKEMYPSSLWARKVDRMSDQQAYAIYQRIEAERQQELVASEVHPKQLSLF